MIELLPTQADYQQVMLKNPLAAEQLKSEIAVRLLLETRAALEKQIEGCTCGDESETSATGGNDE